jgi:long-chain fatty acid transport protein
VRDSSALLPNFFGIIQPLGRGRVGFSYAVPDSILEDQNQTFYDLPGTTTTRYAINFNRNDNTYNFGPSYAIELTDSFSIGATLYAHARQNEWIQNQLINKNTGKYEWSNLFYKNTEWGVKPVLGMMWSPTGKLAAGLAISKVSILNSNTKYQAVCSGDTVGSCQGLDSTYQLGTAPVRLISPSASKRVYPISTKFGVAYFPSKELILSGDVSYHAGVKDAEFGDKVPTWNFAIGSEYYWSDKWAIRAGLFSDRANTPVINSGDVNALDHVDLYGGSLSASYFTRQSSLTIGGTYRYGIGKSQILGNNQIQEVRSQAMTVFLSAAYFY